MTHRGRIVDASCNIHLLRTSTVSPQPIRTGIPTSVGSHHLSAACGARAPAYRDSWEIHTCSLNWTTEDDRSARILSYLRKGVVQVCTIQAPDLPIFHPFSASPVSPSWLLAGGATSSMATRHGSITPAHQHQPQQHGNAGSL